MPTIINRYGLFFRINRRGLVEVRQGDDFVQLGETRSRLFLASVVLAALIEIEEGDERATKHTATIMDNLSQLVTGDLKGETMARVFDTLHVLKVEAGDTDVDCHEIAERLLRRKC